VLREVFPDATVAITHRDPVSVIQSAATMIAYGARMSRKHIDLRGIVDYWSDRVSHLLEACVHDRHILAAEQSIDVPFHQFMADDLGMVRRIYDRADMPMNDKAADALRDFIESHPRGKHGRIVYDLEGDFGINPEALRERFRFYFDAFPVEAE
jgi:hypothetical protein